MSNLDFIEQSPVTGLPTSGEPAEQNPCRPRGPGCCVNPIGEGTIVREDGVSYILIDGELRKIENPDALQSEEAALETSALLLPGTGNVFNSFPQGPPIVLPRLSRVQQQDLDFDRFMRTALVFFPNGGVDAVTQTWSERRFDGFTGSVVALFVDSKNLVIAYSDVQTYSVSGFWLPARVSARAEHWSSAIEASKAARVKSIEIVQIRQPKACVLYTLKYEKIVGRQIKEALAVFAELI